LNDLEAAQACAGIRALPLSNAGGYLEVQFSAR
jgi:hypothetical protein